MNENAVKILAHYGVRIERNAVFNCAAIDGGIADRSRGAVGAACRLAWLTYSGGRFGVATCASIYRESEEINQLFAQIDEVRACLQALDAAGIVTLEARAAA